MFNINMSLTTSLLNSHILDFLPTTYFDYHCHRKLPTTTLFVTILSFLYLTQSVLECCVNIFGLPIGKERELY